MKMKKALLPFLILVCSVLFVTPTFARASEQIYTATIDVDSLTGRLAITFDVAGNGKMEAIGCESIRVYEETSYGWKEICNLDEHDFGMSEVDTYSFGNTIYCDTKPGLQYHVYVTVFAEDENGRDTRDWEFYITGR